MSSTTVDSALFNKRRLIGFCGGWGAWRLSPTPRAQESIFKRPKNLSRKTYSPFLIKSTLERQVIVQFGRLSGDIGLVLIDSMARHQPFIIYSVLALSYHCLLATCRPGKVSINANLADEALTARDNSPDPEDFSVITRFAAIGDSYSAGIEAGDVFDGDLSCARAD